MTILRHMTLLLLAGLLAMASCDKHEDIDRAYTDYRYDIVTYLGQNDNGAVFEYLGRDDSSSIRLQSRVDVGNDVKTNHRVLLRYNFVDPVPAANRDIEVYGCSAIFSDFNLHCQVEYTNKARTLMLVADEKTLLDDTVHCYLVHDLRGERASFWRDCYASFNVGALWKRPYLQCLRIHLNDVTFPGTPYYDFNK